MKCIDVNALLDAGHDVSHALEIGKHLESCILCQAELKDVKAISETLKRALTISAPTHLDEKIMGAFKEFHDAKEAEKLDSERERNSGWFGMPRFVFATALILFALATAAAFQIGKMSAGDVSVLMPQLQENRITGEFAQITPASDEKSVPIEIVGLPVIRERIVIRKIYITKGKEKTQRPNLGAKSGLVLKNSVAENGYLTQTNLKGFQPVSEFKIRISKKENGNEK